MSMSKVEEFFCLVGMGAVIMEGPMISAVAAALREMGAEIEKMRAEIEQLHRGEYICIKCGLRHDSDLPKGDF